MRILIVFLLCFGCLSCLLSAPIKVTIVCDESLPPYSYLENGELKGIYPAICKEIFSKMKDYEVTLEPMPWARAVKNVENGTVFGVIGCYYRPVERSWMDFSLPVFEEQVAVYVKESTIKKRKLKVFPDDFEGMLFAKNTGFLNIGNKNYFIFLNAGKIREEENKDNRTNLYKLNSGLIDCYINDRYSVKYELNRLKKKEKFDDSKDKIVECLLIGKENAHLGMLKNIPDKFKFHDDFKHEFNKYLIDLIHSAKYQKIIQHNL